MSSSEQTTGFSPAIRAPHTLATKDGVGLSDTRLWDEKGPIGRGVQCLVVRPRTVHAEAGGPGR